VNAAAAAVRAGATASVIGRIGSDAAGALILTRLEELGIDAALARDAERQTGAAVVFAGPGDARSVVASRGANARLTLVDIPETIEADALLVSGFALFQSGSSTAAAAAIERFTGDWLGVDLGSPRIAESARDFNLPAVLFATAEEAQALTGARAEEAARTLAASHKIACVKLGEEGAIAASGDQLVRRRLEPVERRSPFGAGDAFAAVFLVELTRGAQLGAALERACAAGARAAAAA
jgi:sugar/nucleoside kinase (ribokinase family)